MEIVNSIPKFIAFYLPQYHVIPENNEWWGNNFTEWIRLKNSKPLFNGHHQPRIPYEYYDLSDVNVMIRQAEMAKTYGIYGFCYYHYWFNGKKLLEKPLEQMLCSPAVNIPFCLSWANEPWTRAWDGNKKETLIAQKYGERKDWLKHLDYLLPFFSDKRYIRKNDHPVLIIYRTSSFESFDDMIACWNEVLNQKGLRELYIIETLNSYQKHPCLELSRGVMEFEPMYTVKNRPDYVFYLKKVAEVVTGKKYRTFNYDSVWKRIIERRSKFEEKELFLGAFVDWDNSPRFKKDAAIFVNGTPEKFSKYLNQQAAKSNSEYIFLNAWNEWAEGAYLEPDHRNGYAYLEAVKKAAEQKRN